MSATPSVLQTLREQAGVLLVIAGLVGVFASGVVLALALQDVAPEQPVDCTALGGLRRGASLRIHGCVVDPSGALELAEDGNLLATVSGTDTKAVILPLRAADIEPHPIVAWLAVPPRADVDELTRHTELIGEIDEPRANRGLGLLDGLPYVRHRLTSAEIEADNRVRRPLASVALALACLTVIAGGWMHARTRRRRRLAALLD